MNDFIAQWRDLLPEYDRAAVSDLKDAAKKLNLQSGTQSPILGLFWLASQNTGVDYTKIQGADRIQKAFQSVHHVVPPANVDRYVAPSNQPYVNALLTLQTSVDQAAQMPTPDPATANTTLSNATSAKISVKQVAQGFNIDQETHLEATLQKLLEDPITNAEGLLRGLGPAELNGKGKGLCAQFSAVTNKYPFNTAATAEASIAEVNSLLKPGEGALWAFYDANLKQALVKQGAQYVPTGTVPLTPQFVSFFNTAAKLSEVLYKPGAPDPKLMYTLTPLKSEGIQGYSLNVDGQTLASTGGGAEAVHVAGRRPGGASGKSRRRECQHLLVHRTVGDVPADGRCRTLGPGRLGVQPRMGRTDRWQTGDPGKRRSGCRSRHARHGRRPAVLQERQPRRAALRIAGGQIECNFRLASGSTN